MVMMHSFLLSRGYEGYEYTDEDIVNMSNPDVSICQIDLYTKVIRLLSEGKTYEEEFRKEELDVSDAGFDDWHV